ncbi:MAG: hypothetical protein ABSD46_05370 [Bacteroidota bacterium]
MRAEIFVLVILLSFSASAQQSTFQDSLLDRMVGHWILKGTIAGKETTHDVDVEWVLAHQYIQLHEISREKDSSGQATYEAIVYIAWNRLLEQYACLWLDVTSGDGLSNGIIGHAKRDKDRIAFLFEGSDKSLFHTTFLRDRNTDTWQWLMDGEEQGKLQPFARVKLVRK